jgi:hypothetical protein
MFTRPSGAETVKKAATLPGAGAANNGTILTSKRRKATTMATAKKMATKKKLTASPVKTLFLYEAELGSKFFELDGDYSHLHEVFINGVPPKDDMDDEEFYALIDELSALVYDKDNEHKFKPMELAEPTRDWTHFVKCGCLP